MFKARCACISLKEPNPVRIYKLVKPTSVKNTGSIAESGDIEFALIAVTNITRVLHLACSPASRNKYKHERK